VELSIADYIGILGNSMLLGGPVLELIRVHAGTSKLKPSGLMVFLIVVGILLNSMYQALTVSPIPVWSFVQNFLTMAVWLEIYMVTVNQK